MQDYTTWYLEQSPEQNNIIVTTHTIVHLRLDVMTIIEVKKYQKLFTIKFKHIRLSLSLFDSSPCPHIVIIVIWWYYGTQTEATGTMYYVTFIVGASFPQLQ